MALAETIDAARADAAAAGRAAGLAGDPVTACPYRAQTSPAERVMARAWVSAYLDARPPAAGVVDYDGVGDYDGAEDVVARHLLGQHDQRDHGRRHGRPHAPTVTAPAAARPTGPPRTISTREFQATVPVDRRLYRGVNSPQGAAATRAGKLGTGDFGPAVYMGPVALAQTYMRRGDGGRMLRGTVADDAVVAEPPHKVSRRGHDAIVQWATDNNVDAIDMGGGRSLAVRNPAVLILDERDYTPDESVILDYVAGGYSLDVLREEYAAAIDSLTAAGAVTPEDLARAAAPAPPRGEDEEAA